jgi:hypothetical protein
MLTIPMFTITKIWKQSKGLLTDMDKQNVVYSYNRILFSHKRSKVLIHG